MIYNDKYSAIRPYSEEEALMAFERISHSAFLPVVSKFFFPKEPINTLAKLLRSVHSIADFQDIIMGRMVKTVIDLSTSSFNCSGIENIKGKTFLAISNHRDILLDPAFIEWMLLNNNLSMTEICIGSNLLGSSKIVDDLLRSNRMIRVIRGISSREMYLNSQLLSSYIRECISSGNNSIWISQREGRSKNGLDSTEQGLLKMLNLSGGDDFELNFKELNIVPLSISYEYEPCDIKKARELYFRQKNGFYTKKHHEDTKSIMTGIKQYKGGVQLNINKAISEEEILKAKSFEHTNERLHYLKEVIDNKIVTSYKLWKTNYMAYDLLNKEERKYSNKYSETDLQDFISYTEKKLNKVEKSIDRNELRRIFLEIYSNPIKNKAKFL